MTGKTAWTLALMALSVMLGGFEAAAAKQKAVGGRYACYCKNGNGSCSTTTQDNKVMCGKGTGDTCSGSCELVTTTSGLGGALASGAVKGTANPSNAGAKQD